MKLKKFISVISAIALCASFAATAVNAELSYDADADVVTMPTKAEVMARQPKITLDAVKTESKDDVIAAGIASKQAGNYIKAEWDTYIVTMTASNLGELAVGYTDDTYETQTGLVIPAVVLSFTNSDKILKYAVGDSTLPDKSSVGVQGTLNYTFGSATNVDYSYPKFDDDANGTGVTNPVIEGKMVICIADGSTFDLVTEAASVTYILLKGSIPEAAIVETDVDTLTLGEKAPAKETTSLYYEATAENVTSANNGVKFTVATSDPDATAAASADVDVDFKDLTVEAGNVVVGLIINNIYTTAVDYVTVTTSLY